MRFPARLYVDVSLAEDTLVPLDSAQSHYLTGVLRLQPGHHVGIFNGRDGEWRARLDGSLRKSVQLRVEALVREQDDSPDLWLLAAPIKGDRTEYVVEKATELGVSRILPVMTARTVVGRINLDRLQSRAREAAQQCERLSVPEVMAPQALMAVLESFPRERRLVVCDESGAASPIAEVLKEMAQPAGPLAVLVGPEGGFAREELDVILKLPFVKNVSLGPRVLRADTASIVAVSIVQALLGDGGRKRIRI